MHVIIILRLIERDRVSQQILSNEIEKQDTSQNDGSTLVTYYK